MGPGRRALVLPGFHAQGSPPGRAGYDYLGNRKTPRAGLSPAGSMLLWAALERRSNDSASRTARCGSSGAGADDHPVITIASTRNRRDALARAWLLRLSLRSGTGLGAAPALSLSDEQVCRDNAGRDPHSCSRKHLRPTRLRNCVCPASRGSGRRGWPPRKRDCFALQATVLAPTPPQCRSVLQLPSVPATADRSGLTRPAAWPPLARPRYPREQNGAEHAAGHTSAGRRFRQRAAVGCGEGGWERSRSATAG